jgi:type I restriction enzyme S subunit
MNAMDTIARILTDNLDIWTGAIERRSTAGRGQAKKFGLYGIEKLRALILNLAVRGQLVPQLDDEEPGTELSKQIANEKARRAKAGEIRSSKATAPIRGSEPANQERP